MCTLNSREKERPGAKERHTCSSVAFWISRSGRQPAVKVGGCESIGIDHLSKCFVHSWFAVSHSFSADERTWLDVRIHGVAQTPVATEGGVDGRSMRLAPIPRHGTPSHPKHSWTRSFRSMMGRRRARLGLQGRDPQAGQDYSTTT